MGDLNEQHAHAWSFLRKVVAMERHQGGEEYSREEDLFFCSGCPEYDQRAAPGVEWKRKPQIVTVHRDPNGTGELTVFSIDGERRFVRPQGHGPYR